MTRALVLLAIVIAGCSKPAPSVTSGDRTTSDSATRPVTPPPVAADATAPAPAADPLCMHAIDDTSTSAPSLVAADARSLYVCAGSARPDNAEPQCFAVDRATGAYRAWKPGPGGDLDVGGFKAWGEAGVVKACRGTACSTIKVKGASDELNVSVNEAGTYVALSPPDDATAIDVYEVKSGKRTAHLVLPGPGCNDARFVGDLVMTLEGNCGGPDSIGSLYTTNGKKLRRFGGDGEDYVNADDPQLVHLDGTRWAIGLPMSNVLYVVDGKTGKTAAEIALDKLDGEVSESGPANLIVERSGPSTLLVATGAASVGEIDLARATLAVAWTAPKCPDAE